MSDDLPELAAWRYQETQEHVLDRLCHRRDHRRSDGEPLVAVSDLKDWLRGKKTEVCDEHRCKDQDIGWNQAIKVLLNELDELEERDTE